MLFNSKTDHLILKSQVEKVMKVCPIYDGSYVLVTNSERSNDEEKLVHVASDGTVLWQKHYHESIDTFAVFNSSQVIVLNVEKNQIELVDLRTKTITAVEHRFSFPDTSHMELHTFYDTRLLCVQQTGFIQEEDKMDRNLLVLTYYRYASHNLQLVRRFESEGNEWIYGNKIAKANNSSKIVWWKEQQATEQIVFNYYQLSQNDAGSSGTVRCRNTLSTILNNQSANVTIAEIWESAPGIYILPCNRTASQGVFRQFYVIDSASGIIREAKFSKNIPQETDFVHFFNLGHFSILYSTVLEGGKAKESPVYFIDNAKEEIIRTGSWMPLSQTQFYLPGYDNHILVEATHAQSGVKEITVVLNHLITVRQMYMHLLLHVNQDFDDDLLQDTMDLLGVINIS